MPIDASTSSPAQARKYEMRSRKAMLSQTKFFLGRKTKYLFCFCLCQCRLFHVRNKYILEVQQHAVSGPSGANEGCAGVERTQADGRWVAGRDVRSLSCPRSAESALYVQKLSQQALPALTPLLSRMFPWGCELCALAVFSCSPHVDSVNFRRFLLPLTPEQLYRSEVSNSLAGKKHGCILPCVVLVKAMSSAIQ